jgi:hypothetical protein
MSGSAPPPTKPLSPRSDAEPQRGHVGVGRGPQGGSGADVGPSSGLGARGGHRRRGHSNLPGNVAAGEGPDTMRKDAHRAAPRVDWCMGG